MKEKIERYLAKLEKENEIDILLACETGSRAWGFPSTDSDFDVRIIYVHKRDWYLSIFERKDTINFMFENNEIDISGWDLKKTLKLLHKSNPPLLERIQSPIIYKEDTDFLSEIKRIAQKHYSRIATIHHYLGMAKKFLNDIKEKEEFKLKKFFYALRAASACLWVIEKEKMPPIEFPKIIKEVNIEIVLKNRIFELISLKSEKSESYLHKGEKPLISFIEKSIERAEEERENLPAAKRDFEELNEFFLKTLERYEH